MAHDDAFKHVFNAARYMEIAVNNIRDVSAGIANGTHGVGAIIGLQVGTAQCAVEAIRELGDAILAYDANRRLP